MMSGAAAAATFCGSAAVIAGAAAVAPGGCVLPQVDPRRSGRRTRSAAPGPGSAGRGSGGGLYFDPLLLGLGALALGALVYFLLIKDGGSSPNSPD